MSARRKKAARRPRHAQSTFLLRRSSPRGAAPPTSRAIAASSARVTLTAAASSHTAAIPVAAAAPPNVRAPPSAVDWAAQNHAAQRGGAPRARLRSREPRLIGVEEPAGWPPPQRRRQRPIGGAREEETHATGTASRDAQRRCGGLRRWRRAGGERRSDPRLPAASEDEHDAQILGDLLLSLPLHRQSVRRRPPPELARRRQAE